MNQISMLNYSVLPSLPAENFAEITALVSRLGESADELQVDLVDGLFAPYRSWPFTTDHPNEAILQLASLTSTLSLEVDCMINQPEKYLQAFAQVGVKKVIIHFGSTNAYQECLGWAKEQAVKIGLAVSNDTAYQEYEAMVDEFDYVQVMGIKNIGVQGQEFDPRTIDTIGRIREAHQEKTIAVDGAVNHSTISVLLKAGASRFAPGSAVTRAEDPALALESLRSVVTEYKQ